MYSVRFGYIGICRVNPQPRRVTVEVEMAVTRGFGVRSLCRLSVTLVVDVGGGRGLTPLNAIPTLIDINKENILTPKLRTWSVGRSDQCMR